MIPNAKFDLVINYDFASWTRVKGFPRDEVASYDVFRRRREKFGNLPVSEL